MTTNQESSTENHLQGETATSTKRGGFALVCFEAISWWTTLLVAVLAIPAASIIITLSLPISDTAKVISFVLSCWLCTWLGMWLMRKSDLKTMQEKDK